MKTPTGRRAFLKEASLLAGAAALGRFVPRLGAQAAAAEPDIAVASGESPRAMTARALDLLGGIGKFVKKGDKVVLLPNPQGNRPGVSTTGEIVAEVIAQCWNAGAASVQVASIHSPGRWYSSGITSAVEKAEAKIFSPSNSKDIVEMDIPRGRELKRARIVRLAVECDVLINMPIVKQHDSSRLTGCLKNLMGFNEDNASFHASDRHLHGAIADLATLFKPKLAVVDAVRILGENGPFGPGKLLTPKKVLAGTDQVALDAYGCGFLGLKPIDVEHIVQAAAHGLGRYELAQLRIEAQSLK